MFGITEDKKGYIVRLLWKDKKPRIQMYFSRAVYGESALSAAKLYRDLQLIRFKKKGIKSHKGVIRHHKCNKSGIIGIRRKRQSTKKKGKSVPGNIYAWEAYWRDEDGRQRVAQFSEAKYGPDEAMKRAIACRYSKKNIFRHE